MQEERKIIDLFCGAGGFSLGAHFAGFQTALAVDIDTKLTSSFSDNFPKSRLLVSDIKDLSGAYLLNQIGARIGDISGIIGGPPCQGFSLMGHRNAADPRNGLIEHFFRLVREIQPRFFVMENVPGILLGSTRSVLENAISDLNGYSILGPVRVNASDFGAATNRDRVIVIGLLDGKIDLKDLNRQKTPTKSSVRQAISDIPNPITDGWGEYRDVLSISSYASRARKLHAKLGAVQFKRETLKGRVSGLQPTIHTSEVQRRFSSVAPGTSDNISKCPRLTWHALAPTLRAGTGPDRGSFQSIRPIHPDYDRVISVREAARLQGFSDWFKFHNTKWHSFRMIGNSVSPFLSEAILKAIARVV